MRPMRQLDLPRLVLALRWVMFPLLGSLVHALPVRESRVFLLPLNVGAVLLSRADDHALPLQRCAFCISARPRHARCTICGLLFRGSWYGGFIVTALLLWRRRPRYWSAPLSNLSVVGVGETRSMRPAAGAFAFVFRFHSLEWLVCSGLRLEEVGEALLSLIYV